MGTSGPITAGSCRYQQANDNVHISSGDVSTQGWWLHYSGTCPARANVDIHLQAVRCSSSGSCGWVTVDTDSGDYAAGGGRGRRATARESCADSRTVGYRSFVDVELIDASDPSGYTYSTPVDRNCYPSS